MAWSLTDLAYLAGIIDGEGTISIAYYQKKKFHRPYLRVGNTNIELINWLTSRFGGNVTLHQYRGGRNKDLHTWVASTRDLNAILEAVLPFLVLKRKQAIIVQEVRKTMKLGRTRLEEGMWEFRDQKKREIMSLNQRGTNVVL